MMRHIEVASICPRYVHVWRSINIACYVSTGLEGLQKHLFVAIRLENPGPKYPMQELLLRRVQKVKIILGTRTISDSSMLLDTKFIYVHTHRGITRSHPQGCREEVAVHLDQV